MASAWEYLMLHYSYNPGVSDEKPMYTGLIFDGEVAEISCGGTAELLAVFDALGAEGWELVSRVNTNSSHDRDKLYTFARDTQCLFKRPVAD